MSLPVHQLVWAEIPVTDLEAARTFYGAVLKSDLSITTDEGPNPLIFLPVADDKEGISAHLYPGKPAGSGAGPTVHLLAPDDLEATGKRVEAAGGKVIAPPIEIPFGHFLYTEDPDGNSVGWFRYKAA